MAKRLPFSSPRAVLTWVALVAVPAAASATGGTITFTGRIVEPPYQIHVSQQALPAMALSASGADLSFSHSRQSASVRVDGVDPGPLVIGCTDARATLVQGCHFGPGGGVMSVKTKFPAQADAASGAIVTITYD